MYEIYFGQSEHAFKSEKETVFLIPFVPLVNKYLQFPKYERFFLLHVFIQCLFRSIVNIPMSKPVFIFLEVQLLADLNPWFPSDTFDG